MTFLTALWHRLFEPNVDAIVADLASTVRKLENAVLHHQNKAAAKTVIITKLQQQVNAHDAEAENAALVSKNINALINPKGK